MVEDKSRKEVEYYNQGNIVCAIDVETTGLDYEYHEIIQLCILPLKQNLDVDKSVLPFYIELKPDFPNRRDQAAMLANKLDIHKIIERGFDQISAIDMLEQWINKLDLPETKFGRKKIIPLGQNYTGFDIFFIKKWLGISQYDEWFHPHSRDVLNICSYINDAAAAHFEIPPFGSLKLSNVAKKLGVEFEAKTLHDALIDCDLTARVYKKLVNRKFLYL